MKPKKILVKTLKAKLTIWAEDLHTVLMINIDNLDGVDSVEDIMEIKKEILTITARFIPLNCDFCYFCQAQIDKLGIEPVDFVADDETCNGCRYAKIHGRCGSEDSTYQKIVNACEALEDEIEQYHRPGDSYGRKRRKGDDGE